MTIRRVALGALALSALTVGMASPVFASEAGNGSSGSSGPRAGSSTTTTRVRVPETKAEHESESPRPTEVKAPIVAEPEHPRSAEKAAALALLDRLSAKVTSSRLQEAEKAALLAAIGEVRVKLLADRPLTSGELGRLIERISHGLEGTEESEKPEVEGSHEPKAPKLSKAPEPELTVSALDNARDALDGASLPPEVKKHALEKLRNARAEAEAQVRSGGDGAAAVRAHLDARLAELREHLSKIVTRLDSMVLKAAAEHPQDPAVQVAKDQLAVASAALATAKTPAEMRAVWTQLREVRASLRAV